MRMPHGWQYSEGRGEDVYLDQLDCRSNFVEEERFRCGWFVGVDRILVKFGLKYGHETLELYTHLWFSFHPDLHLIEPFTYTRIQSENIPEPVDVSSSIVRIWTKRSNTA